MKKTLAAVLFALLLAPPALADSDGAVNQPIFRQCKACHLIGDATGKKIGPSLNSVFGRTAGTLEGYAFSSAMKAMGEKGLVWTPDIFAEYIANPRKFVRGTKMAYAGQRNPDKVADLIDLLLQFSPDYETTEDALVEVADGNTDN